MVLLLAGASHTGKTLLAQRLLERYHIPYTSIDHLKMGLIRSGQTALTPMDDEELTGYLWPIVREMAKTAVENRQDLILEGCYIPFDWEKDFSADYLAHMRCCCLVMTPEYIRTHSGDIRTHANVIEQRLEDGIDLQQLIRENQHNLNQCLAHGWEYILIDGEYRVELEL